MKAQKGHTRASDAMCATSEVSPCPGRRSTLCPPLTGRSGTSHHTGAMWHGCPQAGDVVVSIRKGGAQGTCTGQLQLSSGGASSLCPLPPGPAGSHCLLTPRFHSGATGWVAPGFFPVAKPHEDSSGSCQKNPHPSHQTLHRVPWASPPWCPSSLWGWGCCSTVELGRLFPGPPVSLGELPLGWVRSRGRAQRGAARGGDRPLGNNARCCSGKRLVTRRCLLGPGKAPAQQIPVGGSMRDRAGAVCPKRGDSPPRSHGAGEGP